MGICASSQITRRGGAKKWPPTAMLIDLNGQLQKFEQPIKAGSILSQNPNTFLCSSETMFVGSHVPQVPYHEELQLGQIYFLLPIISKSQAPLSLQDLCALAVKASAAFNNPIMIDVEEKKLQSGCRIQTGFGVEGLDSPVVAGGSQKIEFYDQ